VTVFGSRDDAISADALQAWQRHAAQDITLRYFPGGHFYFRQHQAPVLRALAAVVRETTPMDRAA